MAITVVSCSNDKAQLKVDCVIPATVSFSKDIMPIFNAQCSTAGCHTGAANAGRLNLETSVAYAQLLHAGSGYVDTLNPQASILYNKLTASTDFMPPIGRLDDCKIKMMLKWIQQHAKNN